VQLPARPEGLSSAGPYHSMWRSPTVTLLAHLDCDGAGGQVFLDCDTDGFDERPAAIDFRSSDVKGMLCHGER
jgi:hypothetical protein